MKCCRNNCPAPRNRNLPQQSGDCRFGLSETARPIPVERKGATECEVR